MIIRSFPGRNGAHRLSLCGCARVGVVALAALIVCAGAARGAAATERAAKARAAVSTAQPRMHLRGRPIVSFVTGRPSLGFEAIVRFTSKAQQRRSGASLVGMAIAGVDLTGVHGAIHIQDNNRDCYSDLLNPATTGALVHPKPGQLVPLVIDVGEPVQQIRVSVHLRTVGTLQSSTPARSLGCIGSAHN
jgi:hypothetical protein